LGRGDSSERSGRYPEQAERAEVGEAAAHQQRVGALKEAVRWAPSAHNEESRFFYFVTSEKKIAELCAATGRQFKPDMGLVIVACSSNADYGVMDVSASVENALLQAVELGLGAVWVGAFNAKKVRAALGIPSNLTPEALVPVGEPAEKPEPTKRKPEKETVKIV